MKDNQEQLSFAQKVDELANQYLKCVDDELNKIRQLPINQTAYFG